jgi:hypothetical protein
MIFRGYPADKSGRNTSTILLGQIESGTRFTATGYGMKLSDNNSSSH